MILEVADDLCHGCQMSEYSYYFDPAWATKYMHMHRYEEPKKKSGIMYSSGWTMRNTVNSATGIRENL